MTLQQALVWHRVGPFKPSANPSQGPTQQLIRVPPIQPEGELSSVSLPGPGTRPVSVSTREHALQCRPPLLLHMCSYCLYIVQRLCHHTEQFCRWKALPNTGHGSSETRHCCSPRIWSALGLRQTYPTHPASQPCSCLSADPHTQQGYRDSLHLTRSLQHGHYASHSASLHPCQDSCSLFPPSSHVDILAVGTFSSDTRNR